LKKTLTILLLVMAFSIVLAGCSSSEEKNSGGSSDGGQSSSGGKKSSGGESSSPVKISTFIPQFPDMDLETNSFTKLAEEKFNIDFEFQTTTLDAGAAAEKRKIALASGDYPELFMLIPWVDQFSQTELIKYGEQGVLLPLNDLIKEHAPNIQSVLDNHSYYAAMATAPDGNIYGLPQLVECGHCTYPAKLWINRAWVENLGMELPTTTDEFKQVLTAFKTQDPNGNGKTDEIPMSGSPNWKWGTPIPYLMNSFIYDDMYTRTILQNGKIDFVANKGPWKQGLAYIKSLYDAGLIDPGAFTQNREAYSQLGNNAEATIMGAGPSMHPGVFVNISTEPSKDYDAIAPLTGPSGVSYASYEYPSKPGATFLLTNKASEEAQIAAIKLVDYMFTQEGQLRAHFGEEGLDWRRPKEGDVPVNEALEPTMAKIPAKEGEEPHNSSWSAAAQYYQTQDFRGSWVSSTEIYEPAGYERRLESATAKLYAGNEPDEVFPWWAIWIDPAVADEHAMLETNIQDYVEQNALQFITGAKDLEQEWDAYVKGLEDLNLEKYLEIKQEAYDNAKF
jgi:putative aldouronate transport system substrate-binding protein